jgi:hypothetical protein
MRVGAAAMREWAYAIRLMVALAIFVEWAERA